MSIYRQLEDCYDQMIHPQKRRDLRLVLEVVMARLCQVKAACVKFGPDGRQSDYLNLENYLLDLRLGPEALEVPIPRYYTEKSDSDDSNKKRDVLDKCLEEHGMVGGMDADNGGSGSGGSSAYMPRLTKEQAIRIIQKNERGRQGMVRARLMKELRDEDSMRKKLTAAGAGQAHPTAAATLIQKVFRGHLVRLKIQKQTHEELVFLGMKSVSLNQRRNNQSGAPLDAAGAGGGGGAGASSSGAGGAKPAVSKYDPHVKSAQIRQQRKTRQIDHELKYIESLVELQKSVTEVEGPEMKDEMWEERYQWWIDQKERTGKVISLGRACFCFVTRRAGVPLAGRHSFSTLFDCFVTLVLSRTVPRQLRFVLPRARRGRRRRRQKEEEEEGRRGEGPERGGEGPGQGAEGEGESGTGRTREHQAGPEETRGRAEGKDGAQPQDPRRTHACTIALPLPCVDTPPARACGEWKGTRMG